MKKLIPAISTALLGAALLGTSTFAWFSANKSVTAENMILNAKADSSLLIRQNVEGDQWSNTKGLTNEVAGAHPYLEPVDAKFDSETGMYTFKALNSDGKAFVNDKGEFVLPDEEEYESKTINDYLVATSVDNFMDTILLLYQGESAAQIEVSASMSTESSEGIFRAMHIAVVSVDVTTGEEPTTTYTEIADFTFENKSDTPKSDTKISINPNEEKEIRIFGWVEGENGDCYNANAVKGDDFTFKLTFSIPSAQA